MVEKNSKGEDRIHILSDGRKLGFMSYGDPNGFPVFAFHGLPGSRIWFKKDDQTSKENAIRLITVDRPGFGISDQKPNRTFLDFSDDIFELSKSLKIDKCSLFGVSGGGVYAAACAYKYPDLIYKAGLVSTVNEFVNGRPPKEMASSNKFVFTLSKRFPWLLKYLMNHQKKAIDRSPEKYIASVNKNTKHLCSWDREIISVKENAEILMVHIQEAFRNGVSGSVSEAKLFCAPWGFDPRKIEIPIELWHGSKDTLAPIAPIKELALKIPNCKEHYEEGKGHFLTEDEEIWKNILVSLKG